MIEPRRLGPADCYAVHQLELVAFPEDPWSGEQLAEELANPSAYYAGVFDQGNLVGAAGVKGVFDADLMTIGVHPDFRGRGIGSALLTDLLDHCRSAAIERVFLEVRASNEAAIALYGRFGFEAIGRIRNYYRQPTEDAVTMRFEF